MFRGLEQGVSHVDLQDGGSRGQRCTWSGNVDWRKSYNKMHDSRNLNSLNPMSPLQIGKNTAGNAERPEGKNNTLSSSIPKEKSISPVRPF